MLAVSQNKIFYKASIFWSPAFPNGKLRQYPGKPFLKGNEHQIFRFDVLKNMLHGNGDADIVPAELIAHADAIGLKDDIGHKPMFLALILHKIV